MTLAASSTSPASRAARVPDAVAAPSRSPRGLVAEAVFIRRSLLHSLRDGESLLMAVLLPVMVMLLFTWIFGGAIDPTGNYVDYIVPGVILLCAGFGASSTALYVATDMETGIIDRFRSMPLRAGAVLTGHVVASVIRNLVATAIVFGVALLLGYRPAAEGWEWAGSIGLIALYILAITYLFAAIGMAAGSPAAANSYGFILLFLPYLSSAFVPIATMPGWLQPVAQWLPITPIIETLRALLDGAAIHGEGLWTMAWALIWCAGILTVAAAWGAWLFPRRSSRR